MKMGVWQASNIWWQDPRSTFNVLIEEVSEGVSPERSGERGQEGWWHNDSYATSFPFLIHTYLLTYIHHIYPILC